MIRRAFEIASKMRGDACDSAARACGCYGVLFLQQQVDHDTPPTTNSTGVACATQQVRRRVGRRIPAFDRFEYLIPLGTQDELLGAIALGPHRWHALYSSRAIRSFRVLGNVFSIALANPRHVREVQERRRKGTDAGG